MLGGVTVKQKYTLNTFEYIHLSQVKTFLNIVQKFYKTTRNQHEYM